MRILIAEDDDTSRLVLETTLRKWGYEVLPTADGEEAWRQLQGEDPPQLAVLDWMMPNLDGVALCRRIRSVPDLSSTYIIMLTARDTADDMAEALNAGADDYVSKPPNRKELRARLEVGVRVVELRYALAQRVEELERALAREKRLEGLLPICSYCKKIRDDRNYWQQVERFIEEHSEAAFSHSICPDCYRDIVQPQLDALAESAPEPDGPDTAELPRPPS
jgi:phosphoserine phosphatase RsbU/P